MKVCCEDTELLDLRVANGAPRQCKAGGGLFDLCRLKDQGILKYFESCCRLLFWVYQHRGLVFPDQTTQPWRDLEGVCRAATRSLQVAHEGMEDDVAFILCLASDAHSVLAQATLMLDR